MGTLEDVMFSSGRVAAATRRLRAGDYYIGSIGDVTEIVPELSPTNNTLATPGRNTWLPVATGP